LTVSNGFHGLLAHNLQSSVIMLAAIGVSFALHPLIIEFTGFSCKKVSTCEAHARRTLALTRSAPQRPSLGLSRSTRSDEGLSCIVVNNALHLRKKVMTSPMTNVSAANI
jgi:hypothetical protein